MHDDTKIKALLDKIRKLKAKADDASTTEEESLAFAAKVAELLAQHGLEEAQLATEDQEQLEHEDHVSNWNSSPARRVLVIAICKLYMVTPLVRSAKGQPWTLVGRKHNIFMVKEMSTYLIKTTIRLSNQYGRDFPEGDVIDFRRGCFKRLSERIIEMHWQSVRAAQPVYTPQGNPGNLPALIENEFDLMRGYIQQKFGKLGKLRKQRVRMTTLSGLAGHAAGDKISLNQQVGSGKSNHLIGRK